MAKVLDIDQNQTCSGPFLAEALGVDVRTITRLTKQGVFQKRGRGQYRLWQSISAYIAFIRGNRGIDEDACEDMPSFEIERGRLYREKADKAVMENALLRGELHTASAIDKHVRPLLMAARAKFLSIPNACGAVVAGLSSTEECIEVLESHCREVCEELSAYDPMTITRYDRREILKGRGGDLDDEEELIEEADEDGD